VIHPAAFVVGAELTLVNTANKIEAKFTTNDRGEYMFRNLTPGTYELRVVQSPDLKIPVSPESLSRLMIAPARM